MSGPGSAALAILTLTAFALAIGGIWRIAGSRDWRRGGLMLVAAIVFLGNVVIWSWPV